MADIIKNAVRDQSIKADGEKIRLELITPEALLSLGRVLTFGATKYSAYSWRKVSRDRYTGALLRHLTAYMMDPNSVDAESGLRHSEHLLCNAMFLNDEKIRGQEESI